MTMQPFGPNSTETAASTNPDSAARQMPERRRAPRYGPTINPVARDAATQLRGDQSIPQTLIASMALLLEFMMLLALGAGIYALHVYRVEGILLHYMISIVALPVLAISSFQAAHLYTVSALRSPVNSIARAAAAWIILYAIIAVFMFLTKSGDEFSRVMYAGWFASGAVALFASRMMLYWLVSSWSHEGKLDRRAVIVGGGADVENLVNALEASSEADLQIVGIFDDRDDDRSPLVQAGYRKLGTTDELVEFVRLTHVDLMIVSLPLTAQNRLLQVFKKLWVLPVDIRLSAHANSLRFKPRTYSYIGNVPFLDILDRPMGDWDYVLKSVFDRAVAALALLALSPVMLATAIAVKATSKGPIFFKQHRYGFNNELIGVYKFRSMFTEQSDANATTLVTKGDPRVTPVGRFIRKTSLDELPQLINVLKGQLSLVGPRPHAVQAKAADVLYNEVVDGYFARHRVKPGITGWAQINGWRGETDTREKIERRVEHDLYYIENWSVFFDIYILALTPLKLFKTESAY